MVVPQIDVHGIPRPGLLAPQLPRAELHRVDVLRRLGQRVAVDVRILKRKGPWSRVIVPRRPRA